MNFNNYQGRIILRVLFLFISLCAVAYFLVKEQYAYTIPFLPLIFYQVYSFILFQQKIQQELKQFVKSIQYRDFSVHLDEKRAPAELKVLRRGLNEINAAFRIISREKETQYHYLQKIIEMVDTGILSYEQESGEVVWMNEALKKLLQVPYLRTIDSLAKRDQDLLDEIQNLAPGQSKIAAAQPDKHIIKVLLSATAFHTQGKKYKLLVFQNVNEALDETESKAWQKLLSVMTHEIMNSVAPISSLAGTLKNRLQETVIQGASSEDIEDLQAGFSTIERRSEGLLKFAETYRNLNKITSLRLEKIYVKDLFSNLDRLMQPSMKQKNIQLEIQLKDPGISLDADANLLDQVLINLIVNAMEATKEQPTPKISLSAYVSTDRKIVIKISDNGTGMSREVQEKIFIPFFSTKKQGSGIGLSLCKQIIMLHKGSIQVQSAEGVGTSFLLRFG